MTSLRKYLACSILAVALVLLFIPAVRATAESFIVRAGQEKTRALNLATEDHVQIRFTVTGQAANVLDFYIADPNGNEMATFGTTGNVNYAFICSQESEYNLHFSNIASAEDKLVSLDYEVQYYIFGMDQMLLLTLIVVGICVNAVTVFIAM